MEEHKPSFSGFDRLLIVGLVLIGAAVLITNGLILNKVRSSKASETAEPTVQVSSGSVRLRPISDWLKNNPPAFSIAEQTLKLYFGEFFPDPNFKGYVGIFYSSPPPAPQNLATVTSNGQVDGYIIERKLTDGRARLDVQLQLKDGPFTLYRGEDIIPWFHAGSPLDETKSCWTASSGNPPDNRPCAVLGEDADGKASVDLDFSFILPAPGMEIPYHFESPEYLNLEVRELGKATGSFTKYAAEYGFLPGTQGNVNFTVVNPHVGVNKVWELGVAEMGALGDEFPAETFQVHQSAN